MDRESFEKLVAEEFPRAVPEKFRSLIENLAFLIEDEPSFEIREEQGLEDGETLLGLYTGLPLTARGEGYGVGATMPDTVVLYQLPLEEEAEALGGGEEALRRAIRETIWHEVAHHFGFDDTQVGEREAHRE